MTVDEVVMENLCQEERDTVPALIPTDLRLTRGLLLRVVRSAENLSGLTSPEAQWLIEVLDRIAKASHTELEEMWRE
jgi:hypothetical protein